MRGAYYSEFDPGAAAWLRELIGAGLIPAGDVDERDIREVEPTELAEYRQCHFFCGVGGWPLALRLAGWPDDRPVWTGSCPCQPFSSAGKRKGVGDERHLWPDFLRLIEACRPPVVFGEQVASAEVVGTELEAAFVVAVRRGDHARANKLAKRLAQSGSFHFHRRWLDGVRADLEGAGYAFGSSVLGAHSAGAPHIRQRLYWVADAGGEQRQRRQGQQQPTRPAPGEWGQESTHAERGRPVGRMADADGAGQQPVSRRVRGEVGDDTGRGGPALGVEHPESHGREQRRAGADGRGVAGGCGVGVAQGDANQPGPQGRGVPDGGRAGERAAGAAGGDAGFWAAYDLIPCRDGKARRVEPGTFPLADGFPARVAVLRGFGNAIVPQVAAVFVRAWLEVTGEG